MGRTGSATPRATGRRSGSTRSQRSRSSRTGCTSTSTPAAARADPIEVRRQRVDAEASRLAGLGASITCIMEQEGLDHYAVGMKDPEGNEFDIN